MFDEHLGLMKNADDALQADPVPAGPKEGPKSEGSSTELEKSSKPYF